MADTAGHRPRLPRWLPGVWLLLGLSVLAVVIAVASYEIRYLDRIYDGVRVDDIALGGLTPQEAGQVIRDRLPRNPGAPVTLQYITRTWTLTPGELGIAFDASGLAAKAFAVGRESMAAGAPMSIGSRVAGLWWDLATQYAVRKHGYAITPTLTFDENRLAYALKRIALDIDLSPVEASIVISGTQVLGTPGRPGRRVDLEAARAALLPLLLAGRGGTIELRVEERLPGVGSVEDAVAQANAILRRPLTLIVDGADGPQRFVADASTVIGWLSFSPEPIPGGPEPHDNISPPSGRGTAEMKVRVAAQRLVADIKRMAASVDRPSRDAELDFDPQLKQVMVLAPSQMGQQLDQGAAATAIERALLSTGVNDADVALEVLLPVKLIPPTVDSTKTAEMGIVELVSEGTTYFAGSTRERIQNIIVAARKFAHVVVPPEAEFSFNKHLGDVTTTNGFVDSLIIRGDRTEVGIGGGVCQVSTTAFRAAFQGGFPILERHPHSYVVSWYGDPGLDATIYTPNVDFRFSNDTGHFLLIKSEVDTAKGRITFYIYGTRPDRTVEWSRPTVANLRPPDKPLYELDPALPKGVTKQIEWPKNGQDVTVIRTIRNGDGTVREDRFFSRYQPWRAVYLYGPGTALPAGVEIAPTPTPKAPTAPAPQRP